MKVRDMGKFDHTQLSQKEKRELVAPLAEALTQLRKPEEMQKFLSKLLSASELVMISRRFQVADQLVQGASYYSIREKLGVGFSTIQTVENWLAHSVRDYFDLRAKEKREENWKKQHQRNLQFRLRHGGNSHWLLVDLLTQAAAIAKVKLRRGVK